MRLSTEDRRRLFGPPCDVSRHVPVTTPWGITVACHRLVAMRFIEACRLAASASAWRPARIDSYNCRDVRGRPGNPSLHSWALAWDFFDSRTPGTVWGPANAPNESFARSFERLGFTWGARWSRPDWPHIEWAGPPPDAVRTPQAAPSEAGQGGHDEEDDVKYFLVQRKGEAGVWVTDGVRLVKPVPSPRIRDILAFTLGPVKVIDDDELWRFLAEK